MFCANCGKQLGEDGNYCSYCGFKIVNSFNEKSEINTQNSTRKTIIESKGSKSVQSPRRKMIFITIGIILGIIIGCSIGYTFTPDPDGYQNLKASFTEVITNRFDASSGEPIDSDSYTGESVTKARILMTLFSVVLASAGGYAGSKIQ